MEQVDVNVSSKDPCCIQVSLLCLAVEGDGLGLHEANDGGLLAAIMAAGFKGIIYQHFMILWFGIVCNIYVNNSLWQVNSIDFNLEFQLKYHGLMLGILMVMVQ